MTVIFLEMQDVVGEGSYIIDRRIQILRFLAEHLRSKLVLLPSFVRYSTFKYMGVHLKKCGWLNTKVFGYVLPIKFGSKGRDVVLSIFDSIMLWLVYHERVSKFVIFTTEQPPKDCGIADHVVTVNPKEGITIDDIVLGASRCGEPMTAQQITGYRLAIENWRRP